MSIVFIVANKQNNAGIEDIAGEKYFTDCTLSISHTFSNQVTEHAVEDKASFSDHVQVMNNTFTVSGMYNKVTINPYTTNSIDNGLERLKQAYKFLLDLRDNRSIFTLVSKYDAYPNCVVSNLSIPVNPDNSNGLQFDMEIKQIRVATTSSISIVQTGNVAEFKKDDAANQMNGGKKQPKSSILREIRDLRDLSGNPTGDDNGNP